ncbi:MAG: hypothetical protein K8U57_12685 [Planctomycetes bacterium]|nr:hypothetical protein [Planctomycetota bacterium]
MRAEYVCPECEETILAPESLAGSSAPCPKCKTLIARWPLPLEKEAIPLPESLPAKKTRERFEYVCPACNEIIESGKGLEGSTNDCPECGSRIKKWPAPKPPKVKARPAWQRAIIAAVLAVVLVVVAATVLAYVSSRPSEADLAESAKPLVTQIIRDNGGYEKCIKVEILGRIDGGGYKAAAELSNGRFLPITIHKVKGMVYVEIQR